MDPATGFSSLHTFLGLYEKTTKHFRSAKIQNDKLVTIFSSSQHEVVGFNIIEYYAFVVQEFKDLNLDWKRKDRVRILQQCSMHLPCSSSLHIQLNTQIKSFLVSPWQDIESYCLSLSHKCTLQISHFHEESEEFLERSTNQLSTIRIFPKCL